MFDAGSIERDFEIHQAAEALLIQRAIDLQPVSPLGNFAQPYPYHSTPSPGALMQPMAPTQEDLEVAQWLSNYRVESNNRQFDFSAVPQHFIPKAEPQSAYAVHEAHTDVFNLPNHFHAMAVLPSHDSSSPEEDRRFFVPQSPFEHVDHNTRILLDYFETEFAQLISVAPRASNNLLRVFLPMAVDNEGVRNAIAGWSATHLRDIDDKFDSQSCTYMKLAATWLETALEDEMSQDLDATLAVALIICAVEVCKDTDSQWARYRRIAHEIIKRRDLIHTYGGREQIFLLKNFAYHDVMSSTEPGMGTELYHETQVILTTIPNIGGPDCYMGICTGLYSLISESTSLAARVRLENWTQRTIATHASRLIVAIDSCEPNQQDLFGLKAEEQAKHSAMFKILQLTAKLYINQILLRYNSTSIGSQILIQTVMPLLSSLQTVLVEMLFPLFIIGVDALGDDQKKVGRMMEIMFERFRIGNVRCAFSVMEKCWEANEEGEVYVDWNELSYTMFGQCISLA